MKITTQQIQNIIKEELDNLLHEDETDSKLNKALNIKIGGDFIKQYDMKVKQQMLDLIKNTLPKIFGSLEDENSQKILKYAEADPKQGLEMIRSLYDNFTPDEDKMIENIGMYPFDEDDDVKKEFIVKQRMKTKDLSGLILMGADLSGTKLNGVNLSGARLDGLDLRGAELNGANLSGSDLTYAKLHGASLIGANLSGAKLKEASLIGANLSKANLHKAYLFVGFLKDANLSGANLSGATLEYADLRRANLSGADLSGVNLSEAGVEGANLQGAKLDGADLLYTEYDDNTQWPEGFDFVAAGAEVSEQSEEEEV